jgi:hypothetical protein
LAQIGFVVPDMDAALAAFQPLYGHFSRARYENQGCDYRGKPTDCTVDVAFGFSGDIEIEIIQPVSGDGPHREFIAAGKSGMHHLQYRFDNIDACVQRFLDHGFTRIWHKRYGAGVAVAYVSHPDFPLVIELVEPDDRAGRASGIVSPS